MSRFLIVLFLISLAIAGCGKAENTDDFTVSNQDTSENPASPPAEEDLPAESPNVVYPKDWSQVIINANFAKTIVTTVAHFSTDRNACGKEAYGPIDLEAWNGFTKNLNEAIPQLATQSSASPYCVPAPSDDLKFMNDKVQIKLERKSITLYEYIIDENGEQICSKLKDHELSNRLLTYVNKIIVAADKEDCPNGWGSALR